MLAYRPDGAPNLLDEAVDSAAREGRLQLLELARLSDEESDELLHIEPEVRRMLYQVLVEVELEVDRMEAARIWADRASHAATRTTLPAACAAARRSLAVVLVQDGRAAEAIALASEACELFGDLEFAIETARSRMVLGRALAGDGCCDEAIAALEAAHAAWCDARTR